ncbi:hypothetical protein ACFWU3_22370 [Streptomyces sp. NPDC058685]|uniref:hypothetical protein n=1 Tax=Streptomyces sp. NPDC058685 TaxID=3346598 RepID=UPI00364AAAC7
MGIFRRRRRSASPGDQQQRYRIGEEQGNGDYARVLDESGAVAGLWLRNPHHARDTLMIDALLHKLDQPGLMGTAHRVVANTVDGKGGLFVMFGGRRAPGEPEPAPFAHGEDSAGGEEAAAGGSLMINGNRYPLHEDFDPFGRDAAAGRIALLRTTMSGLTVDDQMRLFDVVAAVFGEDCPETRAVVGAGFHCLTCFEGYSAMVIQLRGHLRNGGRSNLRDITECRRCGGRDAVWVYRPPAEATPVE